MTLYTIDQQETIDQQQETMDEQRAAMDRQHAEIEQLKEQNRLVNELSSRLETLEQAGVPNP